MSKLKSGAITLAVAAFGLTLWLSVSENQQPGAPRVEVVENIAPLATAVPRETVSTLALPAPIPTTRPPLAPGAMKTNDFGRQLFQTKAIKTFVLDALKHPEQGGAYYASIALGLCLEGYKATKSRTDDATKYVVEHESTITPERMAAINAIADRCVGFSDGEVATLQAEALRFMDEGRDPLYVLLTALNDTEGTPQYDKALMAAYTSGSAALMSGMFVPVRLIWMTKTNDNGVVSMRFDGQSYVGETDKNMLEAGAALGACVEGEYCDIDRAMLLRCRGFGDCYATREDFMRQQYLSGDQAAIDRATKIAAQIRQAIARGDRSIFR